MTIDPNNLAGTATLTFNDDFNSLSLRKNGVGTWDTNDSWSPDNGHTIASNGEKQWYINANYGPTQSVTPWTVSDGILDITAQNTPAAIKPLVNGYDYTSGMITTVNSFSQQYGYFEIRAELPDGTGLWPAFWLLNAKGGWPPELDVMEQLGQDSGKYYTTVHSQSSGSHTMDGQAISVPDVTAGYHNYGVDWQADDITFYFDGKPVYETATPADMHDPMYMIVNLAVGGYWPGDPVADPNFSETMHVDYVRAYSDKPDAVPAPVSDAAAGTADLVVAGPTQSETATPASEPAAPPAADQPADVTPPTESSAPADTSQASAPTQDSAPDTPPVVAANDSHPPQTEAPPADPTATDPAPAAASPQDTAPDTHPVLTTGDGNPTHGEVAAADPDTTAGDDGSGSPGDLFSFDNLPTARGGCSHHARESQAHHLSDFIDTLDLQSLLQNIDSSGGHGGRHGSHTSHHAQIAALDDSHDFQFDMTASHHGRHGDHHHHGHDWTV